MNELASRYGLALFDIAKEESKVSSMQDESKLLLSLLDENVDFITLLNSKFLTIEEKEEIVNKTLSSFDKDIVSLCLIILKNNRVSVLSDCFKSFNSYCNNYRGIKEGLVYSAFPLDKKTINSLEEKIGNIEKTKIELFPKVDPSLLGGVKVVINDHIYDGSIKTKIENMKRTLLKKGD